MARASFAAYYKQSLKRQGLPSTDIDWANHETNKKAAEYAQNMLDEQQNVSDPDLQGKLFSSKSPTPRVIRKALFPFANFIMNATARKYSDIASLMSKTASSQDKKDAARSLGAYAIELVVFQAISIGLREFLYQRIRALLGVEDDEEEVEKRMKKYKKGAGTALGLDLLSPITPLNDYVAKFLNKGLNVIQGEEEKKGDNFQLYDGSYGDDLSKRIGGYGIAIDKFKVSMENIMMSFFNEGEYTTEFAGNIGTKKMKEENLNMAKLLSAVEFLYISGGLLGEFGTVARDGIKMLKRDAKSSSQLEKDAMWGVYGSESRMKKIGKQQPEVQKELERIQKTPEYIKQKEEREKKSEDNKEKEDKKLKDLGYIIPSGKRKGTRKGTRKRKKQKRGGSR